MKHIFINDYMEEAYVYENAEFQEKFGYKDYLFLNNYEDFDICIISSQCSSLPQYEEICLNGWAEKLSQRILGDSKGNLWFINKDMNFCPYRCEKTSDALAMGNGSHIFIGGKLGGECSLSMDEFCKTIIDLYTAKEEADIEEDIDDLSDIKEAISLIKDDIQAVKEMLSKNEENDEVSFLKDELSYYRNDFYLKSVQRLGLDALLEILESMCSRLFMSANASVEVKESLSYDIKLVERALINKFNVRFVRSSEGTPFNEHTMTTFPDDSIISEDVNLKGCVAASVSPAIFWTIPRVNSGETSFLYKEESVVLYK